MDRLLGRKKDPAPPPPPSPSPPQLSSIEVADPSTLPPGATGVPGATLYLTGAVIADTFVQMVSADPTALTVESVTVPTGQGSAPLIVTVLQGGAAVQVSAILGAQTLQATIVTG